MKKTFNLILFFLVLLVGFSACNDDKEDFVTDANVAKEMIKGTWALNTMWMESNYSVFDNELNKVFEAFVASSSTTFKFDGEYVTTKAISKNGSYPTEETKESYFFRDNLLYVNDLVLNRELPHVFKVSNKTLELKNEFTKEMLLILLEEDLSEADYNQIKDAIPADFSAYMIYKLKK